MGDLPAVVVNSQAMLEENLAFTCGKCYNKFSQMWIYFLCVIENSFCRGLIVVNVDIMYVVYTNVFEGVD